MQRLILVFCMLATTVGHASPRKWIEKGVRDLLIAPNMTEVQKVTLRTRRSRALETLCASQMQGTEFPEACLKLLNLAGPANVLTAAERRRMIRLMDDRCYQGVFPGTKIVNGQKAQLSQSCLRRILSHNQDIDYSYSMQP